VSGGDAQDPVPEARPDHDLVLIWNGLVTRIRRTVGERQDGKIAATTFAGQERRVGHGSGDATSPIGPDPP
jgi:hypothetical protein